MPSLIFEICPEPPIAQANHWPFYTYKCTRPAIVAQPPNLVCFPCVIRCRGIPFRCAGLWFGYAIFPGETITAKERYVPKQLALSRYSIRHASLLAGSGERAASTLTRVTGYRRSPPGKAMTPNYSLNHARSGSDTYTVSTFPLWHRSRRLRAVAILPLSHFH
jgi:hypothetical protein